MPAGRGPLCGMSRSPSSRRRYRYRQTNLVCHERYLGPPAIHLGVLTRITDPPFFPSPVLLIAKPANHLRCCPDPIRLMWRWKKPEAEFHFFILEPLQLREAHPKSRPTALREARSKYRLGEVLGKTHLF